MVWKAAWLGEDERLDPQAVAVIRDVVAGTIAAATPECRLQAQTGPRLLFFAGSGDTVVLAVGSGAWRWQDLVDTARSDTDAVLPAPLRGPTNDGAPAMPFAMRGMSPMTGFAASLQTFVSYRSTGEL